MKDSAIIDFARHFPHGTIWDNMEAWSVTHTRKGIVAANSSSGVEFYFVGEGDIGVKQEDSEKTFHYRDVRDNSTKAIVRWLNYNFPNWE